MEIFIPENVPSSKNNKQWTGKYLVWSKAAQQYKKNTHLYWKMFQKNFRILVDNKIENGDTPVRISFKFIRKSRHKFDYPNPLQTVLDLMVEFGLLPDDNADVVMPVFEEYEYDSKEPGVIIKIL